MRFSSLASHGHTFAYASLVAALLVGCGGGGSTSTTTAAPPATSANTGVSTLVTSVPASTYTGEYAMAFDLLNAERGRCGLGLLAQNAGLDAAAFAHANYTFKTGDTAHTETPGQPGFTGVTVYDRASAKGYVVKGASVSEVMGVGPGALAIRGLLSAPYHLNVLTRGYRDIGIGFQNGDPQIARFVADPGYAPSIGEQLIGASDVATYPCEGTTGVNWRLRGENPNPVPGRNLNTSPIGTPIAVRVRPGNVLVITNSGMINAANGSPVPMRAPVVSTNDPNGPGYFRENEGYVAPDVPLAPNTKYQTTITGTNSGVPFSRTFVFATGGGYD